MLVRVMNDYKDPVGYWSAWIGRGFTEEIQREIESFAICDEGWSVNDPAHFLYRFRTLMVYVSTN